MEGRTCSRCRENSAARILTVSHTDFRVCEGCMKEAAKLLGKEKELTSPPPNVQNLKRPESTGRKIVMGDLMLIHTHPCGAPSSKGMYEGKVGKVVELGDLCSNGDNPAFRVDIASGVHWPCKGNEPLPRIGERVKVLKCTQLNLSLKTGLKYEGGTGEITKIYSPGEKRNSGTTDMIYLAVVDKKLVWPLVDLELI